MRKPDLVEFGLSGQDVEWAISIERRIPVSVVWVSASVSLLLNALSGSDSLPVFLLFWLAITFFIAVVLWFPAKVLVWLLLPRYRKAQRYRRALKRFLGWWARTQKEFWASLSGKQFETELAALFRRVGYRAELTPPTGDQGVDIWLYTAREKHIVQCKAHRMPVGPAIARELYGTLVHFGASGAVLASTSGFTKGVMDYVRGKPIKLLGISDIIALQEKASDWRL